MPATSHDDVARLNVVANLNTFLAARVAPTVARAFERRASPAFEKREGHAPSDRHEVQEALREDPAYQAWSLLRRNTMEYRQQAGQALVHRQADKLAQTANDLNAKSKTLKLDPKLEIPRYVSALDIHLMPGGYFMENVEGDVANPASYDAGLYATLGGLGGALNDPAGRALTTWLAKNHPDFKPKVIVDIGCGVGHNTLPLREAFPDARIVAIDVAAPMLRYANARAKSLGVEDVEFWQEDATRTSLPDGCADLVFTTMVLHETSKEALPRLFAEAKRLLRPGGLTIHLEQTPFRGLPPYEQFMRDWDGRYNNEPFWSALHETSCPDLLEKAGFARKDVFESRCTAPSFEGKAEDFGRSPSWYAVGAWVGK